MRPRALAHVGAAATLLPWLLACCFFPAAPAPAPTTVTPPPIVTAPAIEPLPPPLVGGHPFPFLASQLVVDLPAGVSPDRAPIDAEPPMPGMLAADRFALEGDRVDVVVSDLPCTAPTDLDGAARAELARRHPHLVPGLASRPFPTGDATIRAVELVPAVTELLPDNEVALAFFALDLSTHVIWLRVELRDFDARLDAATRARAEAVLATLRRGTTTFVPHLERGDTQGDLIREVALPTGWVSRAAGCCNEEPPYLTHLREALIPMRVLGEPARARISVRHGVSCGPGVPSMAGVVVGRTMQWTQTDRDLCWVEVAPPADELGVTWHVRGRTPADLAEALEIVPTIRRDE